MTITTKNTSSSGFPETGRPGFLATDLSWTHKRVSVGKRVLFFNQLRKHFLGRGTLRVHAGPRNGGYRVSLGMKLGKCRGKECGSIPELSVLARREPWREARR